MTAPASRDRPVTPDLSDMWPQSAPVPVPGCGRCGELAEARTAARARCDWSAVSDANVLLRRHPDH
ncbi:hypothetical protein [Streptomyces synnematoformans]|uniref:Uncharacterized protein n=1 Tax=Streptomyces synnematoformans TaxID=415721 RepID=A0ABN1ZML3_9ACTN